MSAHSFHASYYINIIKEVENKLMQKLLINGKVHYCCVAINICCDSKDNDVIFLNTQWGLYLLKKQPDNSTAGNANSVLVNATSMLCVVNFVQKAHSGEEKIWFSDHVFGLCRHKCLFIHIKMKHKQVSRVLLLKNTISNRVFLCLV